MENIMVFYVDSEEIKMTSAQISPKEYRLDFVWDTCEAFTFYWDFPCINMECSWRACTFMLRRLYADFTVITSDNPRYEEPMDIIYEIEKGIIKITNNYVVVQDRIEAIKYALTFAEKNDIVLVAGKGCENYQEILGIKHTYNDKTTIENLLKL